MSQLSKQIKNAAWLCLAETILMHDPRQDVELRSNPQKLSLVPPHKSLFNAPEGHGLPIGNLSSQFFANVLLNDLDQFVKHQIGAPHYIRYVDDFVLLHNCPQWLNKARERIEDKLDTLHLKLNPRKTILQPIARGIDFTGQLIKPWRRITRRRTFISAKNRLSDMPDADVYQSANSYFGLLRQATHSHHDRADLANLLRNRGYSIKSDLSKTYPTKN